tara:strand:- start:315 stop:1820 length:1506 start_codon:yes stop_codon:yes gene_type:complete
MSKIRVRFAPSPTGPLHIGGLRTALFNYLFAKKNKGTFIVRIEDTDQGRYVEGSEKHILDSLGWCGLHPDEGPLKKGGFGPYRQSERKGLYKKRIYELLDLGHAYYAFDTKKELDDERKKCETSGKTFIYNARNRLDFKNSLSLSEKSKKNFIEKGEYVIRFKSPGNEETTCYDVLRGKVVLPSGILDDKILYKSDGMPTYHFANVVDDHEMAITHVIRGEEWLPSLALHWLLYESFGWVKPKFVHLPLILKPVGKGKLSKRDGDKFGFPVFPIGWKSDGAHIKGYKEFGFLAESTVNFLALLGWNPGSEKEIFSLKDLENVFSLKALNNSGARFDPEKNIWFNHQHIQALSDEVLKSLLEESLVEKNIRFNKNKTLLITKMIRPRLNLITELFSLSKYFFRGPDKYNIKAIQKLCNEKTPQVLTEIQLYLREIKKFEPSEIKKTLENYVEKSGLGFGKVLGLVRLAIVGELSGADLFDTMSLIEKDACIERIEKLANSIN